MTPLEQAEAILKAAEELALMLKSIDACAGIDDSRVVMLRDHVMGPDADWMCGGITLLRLRKSAKFIEDATSLALALIEKHRALEEAMGLLREIDAALDSPNPTNPDDLRVAAGKLFDWQKAQLRARALLALKDRANV